MIPLLLAYLALGAAAGVIGGLLGVGGGIVLVPMLVLLYSHQAIDPDVIVHLAIGTSLAIVVLSSLSAARTHYLHKAIVWPAVAKLAPGIILGGVIGAQLAALLPSDILRKVFGIFEMIVALQVGLGFKPALYRHLPGTLALTAVALLIGTVSTMVGIAGGTLTVPYLVWCNIEMRKTVATSAALGVPIAVTGAVAYVLTGWRDPALPEYSLGYVYLPALLIIGVTSLLCATYGVRLAHRLSAQRLQRIFALVLAAFGLFMLVG